MRGKNAAVAAALALVALVPLAGHAATEHRAITLGYSYIPAVIQITQGDSLALTNLDIDLHSLTSVETDAAGLPIFDTPFFGVPFLQTGGVSGVDVLEPGSYPFQCIFHSDIPTMHGTLQVSY